MVTMAADDIKPMHLEICRAVSHERPLASIEGLLSLETEAVLSELVQQICGRAPVGPWSNATFDGYGSPTSLSQTDTSLEFCGVMCTFDGSVPLQLQLRKDACGLRYELHIDRAEIDMSGWSEAKRWKEIYLLCHGEARDWKWAHSASGTLTYGA
jgi:hypothetical protein